MPPPSKTNGSSWSSDNLAQSITWLLLANYADLTAKFSDAQGVKMSTLAFLNPASSAEMQDKDAKHIAAIFDRSFTTDFGATFQDGWSTPKAVNEMTSILKDKDKTVGDFAGKVQEIYKFE